MTMSISWTIVTLLSVLGVLVSIGAVERVTDFRGIVSTRGALIVAGVAVAFLVVLGLLYQIEAVAKADGGVVDKLSTARGDVLVKTFLVVTTMGDAVPCILLAGILSIVLMRSPGASPWALILPVVVLAQLLFQFAFPHVFPVLTLSDVRPDVLIDGSGNIPSGSVARFTSIFLVAEMIRRRQRPDSLPGPLPTIGGVLVLAELVTRLYLGRHLVADIFAGMALGVLLSLGVAVLLQLAGPKRDRATTN